MNSLTQQVSAGVEGYGCKFSASVTYNKMVEELRNSKDVYISSSAQCVIYKASLGHFSLPKASPELEDALSEFKQHLTDGFDKQTYYEFFDDFGTHYIDQLEMGSMFGLYYKLSSSSYQRMEKEGIKVEQAASASAWGVTASESTMTDQ